jgi:50S ribosomal subunit-associated GTPase HflX
MAEEHNAKLLKMEAKYEKQIGKLKDELHRANRSLSKN